MWGYPVLREEAETALEQAGESLRHVAALTDIDSLLSQCRQRIRFQPYHALPLLRATLAQIAEDCGRSTQAWVMRGLLARLVLEFNEDSLEFRVTEAVRALYQASLSRIVATSADQRQLDDDFFKDLALASGHLFPAGERVVEPCSVIQRSLIYRAGAGQAVNFVRACLRARGRMPLYRLHVHLSEAPQLSSATWQKTCTNLVEMLRINPGVKGIVGASWFYDPDLPAISPHLAFINDLLRAGGARWFLSHAEGADSGAFARSERRRAAFGSGRYVPRCYTVFWPRRDALGWLEREEAAS